MNEYNLGRLIKKVHANKWVAISADHKRVIAYSEKLISLEKKVGNKKVIYMKAPPLNVLFAF